MNGARQPPHIAIQESQGGSSGDWLEKVTDEQYRR
jgi:hypothetical protein